MFGNTFFNSILEEKIDFAYILSPYCFLLYGENTKRPYYSTGG